MASNFDSAQVVKEAISIIDSGAEKAVLTVYNGNPNTYVTATKGAICIDYTNGDWYKNSDGSTAWTDISFLGRMAMSPWPSPHYVCTCSFPAYSHPVDFPS